ncbi:MAG: GH32 C-terminal domain-containing protein [Ornithinimicrobium sp.]|uniref:GH32 C-terminal domain-containing protein n=1 Tax=Ornithinimicrobium sp. TaxID=1977084 RepID=UPI003D9B8046
MAEDGWAGLLTVPRVVGLAADGSPRTLPAAELESLRGEGGRSDGLCVQPGVTQVLDGAAGSALDVVARLTPGPAGRVWLGVLAAADGSERTEVGVDADGAVYLSRQRSSTRPGTCRGSYRMPVGLDRDGGVDVRVLVDASVVEVFAGDGHALTARVYPQARSSTGLVVGAAAAAGSFSVQWWPVEVQGRSTAPTA